MQMHRGRVAAGAQNQVTLQPLGTRTVHVGRYHGTGAHGPRAADLADAGIHQGTHVRSFSADIRLRPTIDQCNHILAGGPQGGSDPIGGIAVGRHDDSLTTGNAKRVRILVGGAGQHDSGTIVVREQHGARSINSATWVSPRHASAPPSVPPLASRSVSAPASAADTAALKAATPPPTTSTSARAAAS